MALSGSLNTSSYEGRYYQLSWTATQDTATNKSKIAWTLKAVGGSSSWYAERTLKVVIAGTTVFSKTDRVERYAGTIKTGTIELTHNSDGAKSFTASVQVAVYGSSVNCTGSKTFTLNPIARKSTLSVNNGTLGTAQTLTVSQASSGYTHTITYTCGNASGTIVTKSNSTSISFTPPTSLASQAPSGTSVSITYKIETFNGSTSLGSNSYTKTCAIPSSVAPTVSFVVSDENGYFSLYDVFIQGKSRFKIAVTASGSEGSTITAYKVEANGKTYTSKNVTTDVVSASGTQTIKVTVTDSRGRTATASKEVTVLEYSNPKISSVSVYRSDASGNANASGSYLCVKFSASVTPLNSKNTATYKIEYKKKNGNSYTSKVATNYNNVHSITNGICVFSADTSSSYDVVMEVSDNFTNARSTHSGPSVFKLFSVFATGLGFALGKIAELQGVFDIAFQTRFTGGILQPILEDETDFDTLFTPNTFTIKNAGTSNYLNCPLSHGTGTLEIKKSGEETQVHQILTMCQKDGPLRYERFYYQGEWGDWVLTNGDYIIEQGTSGIWTYRKWQSGVFECWGNYSASGINASEKFMDGYYYSSSVSIALPFTLTETPTVLVSGGPTANVCFIREFSSNATTAKFIAITNVSTLKSISLVAKLHVFGKWK